MRYSVGDIVEGTVTGIKPYGAFVSLDSSHNGLIHISEISERYVRDVHTFVSVNQRVRVKILDQDEDGIHFRLSLKAVNAGKKRFARRRHHTQAYPPQQIGFRSLAEVLDGWIEDAYGRRNKYDQTGNETCVFEGRGKGLSAAGGPPASSADGRRMSGK
ncbi:MAG: CvfD/Ygs/GSP13 family RNA-binding post-transcriptional regulator [Merdibacter sp.]|nr:S1 RNA-binding domain-containing protein [Candidatus Merdibacter merdipullorum]